MVFHELWYTNESSVLQQVSSSPFPFLHLNLIVLQAFHPNITSNLKSCLSTPPPQFAQVDLVLAYNLFKEAGKLINLSDWYDAFSDSIRRSLPASSSPTKSNSSPTKSKKGKKKVVVELEDKELQARFVLCVSELARCGFLHGSKRKTEHVAKLIW